MITENKTLDFVVVGNGITADLISRILLLSKKKFCQIGDESFSSKEDFVRSIALSPSTLRMLDYLNIKFPYQDIEQMNVTEGGLSGEIVKGNLIFDKKNNNDQFLAHVAKYSDIKAAIKKELNPKIKKIQGKSLRHIKKKTKYWSAPVPPLTFLFLADPFFEGYIPCPRAPIKQPFWKPDLAHHRF